MSKYTLAHLEKEIARQLSAKGQDFESVTKDFYRLQFNTELTSIPDRAGDLMSAEDVNGEYLRITFSDTESYYAHMLYRPDYRYKVYSGDELLFTSNRLSDVIKYKP